MVLVLVVEVCLFVSVSDSACCCFGAEDDIVLFCFVLLLFLVMLTCTVLLNLFRVGYVAAILISFIHGDCALREGERLGVNIERDGGTKSM